MPYFNHTISKSISIDYTKYKPISVIANYAMDGRIKPEYIRLVAANEEEFTYKINTIKNFRENKSTITFLCTYTNHDRQIEILLIFFKTDHIWAINQFN